jgi:hypothetical protein
VYQRERARLITLGLDPARVIWTAQYNPTADHDIYSVGEDGEDLWIEVKSTIGRDGHFQWSLAEFEKAVRVGSKYELWRVYEADSRTPTYRIFRDPVSLLRDQKLRLDIASFRAEVEPMRSWLA